MSTRSVCRRREEEGKQKRIDILSYIVDLGYIILPMSHQV